MTLNLTFHHSRFRSSKAAHPFLTMIASAHTTQTQTQAHAYRSSLSHPLNNTNSMMIASIVNISFDIFFRKSLKQKDMHSRFLFALRRHCRIQSTSIWIICDQYYLLIVIVNIALNYKFRMVILVAVAHVATHFSAHLPCHAAIVRVYCCYSMKSKKKRVAREKKRIKYIHSYSCTMIHIKVCDFFIPLLHFAFNKMKKNYGDIKEAK